MGSGRVSIAIRARTNCYVVLGPARFPSPVLGDTHPALARTIMDLPSVKQPCTRFCWFHWLIGIRTAFYVLVLSLIPIIILARSMLAIINPYQGEHQACRFPEENHERSSQAPRYFPEKSGKHARTPTSQTLKPKPYPSESDKNLW